MELEASFVDALSQARTWRIADNRLELLGDGGGVLATFSAGAPE
jgi:hypothetical protein